MFGDESDEEDGYDSITGQVLIKTIFEAFDCGEEPYEPYLMTNTCRRFQTKLPLKYNEERGWHETK